MEIRRLLVSLTVLLALTTLLAPPVAAGKFAERLRKARDTFDPDKYSEVMKVVSILAKQPQFMRLFWKGDISRVLLEALRETNEVTLLVPTPDSTKAKLGRGSPYNSERSQKALLRYMLIMHKKVTFTDLVENPAGTKYPTKYGEPIIKSPDSVFFTVIFKTASGKSNTSLAAPNLYEGKFIQLHIVSDLIVPDGLQRRSRRKPAPTPAPPPATSPFTPMTPNPNVTVTTSSSSSFGT